MRVAILLFEGVDLLDVGGPYDVLLTASRLARRDGLTEPFEVMTVSATDAPVAAYGGLALGPSAPLASAAGCDIAIVPGAIDIDAVSQDGAVRAAVSGLIERIPIVASVCTGAFLLGDAGVLDDRPFTTHWEDLDALGTRLDRPDGLSARWVDAGGVVTAGGLSSGIAMALHLVDRLVDRDLATRTARQIDYTWEPEDGVTAT